MPDVLVPVGRHLFSPEALAKQLERVPIDETHEGGAVAGIDSDGVHVALLYTTHDGHLRVRAAYARDWTGNETVAGDVLFRW